MGEPSLPVLPMQGFFIENTLTQEEFNLRLDLVEAILVNKFPLLTIEEIQKMINLREADITQTCFYQQVLEIGRTEGS